MRSVSVGQIEAFRNIAESPIPRQNWEFENHQGVEIRLSNSGIGSANVDDVLIHYEGCDVAADPYDFFIGLSQENRQSGAGVDKAQKGRLIPAGATIQMLQFAPGPNGQQTMLPAMLRLFDFADVPHEWYSHFAATDLKHGVVECQILVDSWRVLERAIRPRRARPPMTSVATTTRICRSRILHKLADMHLVI